jgi:hypothetical protein
MHAVTRDILEELDSAHEPKDILKNYLAFADNEARDRGVRLRIRTDFEALLRLNEQQSDNWPSLTPIFHPECSRLDASKAFWIDGIDASGSTVVTNAARLYELGDRSLADEISRLRVFYDNPGPHIAAGDAIEISAPSVGRIHGSVVFAGAMWVRPDHRRNGFTKIIPRLTRACALIRWNPPIFWELIKPELDAIGITRAYGSWHIEDGILAHMPSWRGDLRFLFLWMNRETLIEDLTSAVFQTGTGSCRWMETPITNVSPPLRCHGISTRS